MRVGASRSQQKKNANAKNEKNAEFRRSVRRKFRYRISVETRSDNTHIPNISKVQVGDYVAPVEVKPTQDGYTGTAEGLEPGWAAEQSPEVTLTFNEIAMNIISTLWSMIWGNKATTIAGLLSLLTTFLPQIIGLTPIPMAIQAPVLAILGAFILWLQHPQNTWNAFLNVVGAIMAVLTYIAAHEPQTVAVALGAIIAALGTLSSQKQATFISSVSK